ncbi:type II toxin-antitoxin system RelE/ParE family toxin [Pararoseomonas sp. SCSIO 73927]|uniref:type II toxin-antitoxin system RelE/ParE family toxin n=1 Tax=Pararoseomonas sp. SCSIO 73927 TaxID=3114537 RepID=UPI0030CC4F4B
MSKQAFDHKQRQNPLATIMRERAYSGGEKPMPQANPDPRQKKALHWVGSSKKDLMSFPVEVMRDIGAALGAAQFGEKAEGVKPWKGEAPGVMEIVEAFDGDAYRTVYAAFFEKAVYVIHAFQKKSPDGGSQTDQRDVDAICIGMRSAREDYKKRYAKEKADG